MSNVFYDSDMDDARRRDHLFRGDLFIYSATPGSRELVSFARQMVEEAFAPRNPELAQHEMPVVAFAELLAALKPKFIHHPRCKELLPQILRELGCDDSETFFDVPRLRTATSNDYLSTGIAYAFHPHRDTWYSAPLCQINWWIPIYPISERNGMAFHPQYWSKAVRNSSDRYNYQEWNRTSRQNAAQHIGVDTREQPKPLEPLELSPDMRLVVPPGGIVVFAAAQLHSSVPNDSGKTRFSIDFRTVNLRDVESLKGAPNIDSRCTGSTMGDYLRASNLEHLPAGACEPYAGGPPQAVRS